MVGMPNWWISGSLLPSPPLPLICGYPNISLGSEFVLLSLGTGVQGCGSVRSPREFDPNSRPPGSCDLSGYVLTDRDAHARSYLDHTTK